MKSEDPPSAAESPQLGADHHPPLRREDMVVLDLWDGAGDDGQRTAPTEGRLLRLCEVARALYAAWLAPLGMMAEFREDGGTADGVPALVLHHPLAARAYAAAPGLGTAVEAAGPAELWVLCSDATGYARLWDELASLRDALAAVNGLSGAVPAQGAVSYPGWDRAAGLHPA